MLVNKLSAQLTINATPTSSVCSYMNGKITVSASNGTAPYEFFLNGNTFGPGNNIWQYLMAGNYTVSVKDANGATATTNVTVGDIPGPTIQNVNIIPATCAGNDGKVTITAAGGTPPYTYSLDNITFQTSNVFTNVTSGAKFTIVKDAHDCGTGQPWTVIRNCPIIIATVTPATCGNADGTITITLGNPFGVAIREYSLDGITFQPSNIFTNLVANNYVVTLRDELGTIYTVIANVTNNCLSVNAVVGNSTCSYKNGSITATALNGTPPYQYSIDGINFQGSNVFNTLGAANYTVTAKDFAGLTVTTNVTITDAPSPIINVNTTPASCANNDGVITITGTGGTAPLTYSIDGITYQPGNVFNNIVSGFYNTWVKDANGCGAGTSVSVVANCLVVTAAVTNSTCGAANGTITATGFNGTAPYLYSIDGINFQSGNVFTGLPAANYIVSLKDANGNIRTTNAIINNIGGPQLNVQSTAASCLNNDATVTLATIGGTAPFTYNIDGGAFVSNPAFTDRTSGNHVCMVKDANGCSSTKNITVTLNNNLRIDPVLPVNICEGKSIQLYVNTNGTGFSWVPTAGLNNSGIASPVASPVITTPYTVTVSLGACSGTQQVMVNVDKAPVPNAGQGTIVCAGQNAQLNGTGGFHYQWTPSTYLDNPQIASPTVVKPASSITYTLTVTDNKGCSSLTDSKVTVTVTPPPTVYAGKDTSVGINQPFQLHAIDVNNSGFTGFEWSPPYGLNNYLINNPVATLDRDIVYKVTAITPNGCEGSDEIKVTVYNRAEIYVPSAFTPGNDGRNDVLKAVPVGLKKFNYFIVYNRWGNQVFYTVDPSKGWNGTLNQITVPTGVYVWIADGIDDKGNQIRRKGTVTLIR